MADLNSSSNSLLNTSLSDNGNISSNVRYRSNSSDVTNTKRMRTGSISGRLRTASDLEESGFIDKKQKGLIKDLIISGDTLLQTLLDKYERGERQELLDLISTGYLLGRKDTIDLLDGLDFDFMNAFQDDDGAHEDNMGPVIGGPLSGGIAAIGSAHGSGKSTIGGMPPPLPKKLATSTNERDRSLSELFLIEHLPSNTIAQSNNASQQVHHPSSTAQTNVSGNAVIGGEQRYRKESLDALIINEMIFDDLNLSYSFLNDSSNNPTQINNSGSHLTNMPTHNTNGQPNALYSLGGDDDIEITEADVFADVYNSFATSGTAQGQPQQRKKSIRIAPPAEEDILNGGGNSPLGGMSPLSGMGMGATGIGGTSDVDLSAYANYAQSLQNSKNKTSSNNLMSLGLFGENNNNNNNSTLGSDNNLNLKLKLENGVNLNKLSSGTIAQPKTIGIISSSAATGLTSNGQVGALPINHLKGPNSNPLASLSNRNPITGFVGAYSPEQRRLRIEKFLEKRTRRVWTRKVKYDVRKNFADSRLRIKGRFVKKEDEDMMRELMSL